MNTCGSTKRAFAKRRRRSTPVPKGETGSQERAPLKSETAVAQAMVLDPSYQEDIRHLNRKYLLLAREMIRKNPGAAETMLGIPPYIQEVIAHLSLDHVDQLLAHPHVLQFQARFPENYWEKLSALLESKKAGGEGGLTLRILSAAHSLCTRGDRS